MPFVVLSLTLAMVVCGVVTVVVLFGLGAYKAPDRRPARKDGVQVRRHRRAGGAGRRDDRRPPPHQRGLRG
ncbi:MAG: hypothetical protein DLM62_10625 [Pseudonocardiales bacterium]|nr:MAG: hypothetical protein DLM62_10625 [Pseudonocardiales bacterium]